MPIKGTFFDCPVIDYSGWPEWLQMYMELLPGPQLMFDQVGLQVDAKTKTIRTQRLEQVCNRLPVVFGDVSVPSWQPGDTILFGARTKPDVPLTRPGLDGKVSCSSCPPVEAIQNLFGREPTAADMYSVVDEDAVAAAGGEIIHSSGQFVTDLAGQPVGDPALVYPEGHVSIILRGLQWSKNAVEKILRVMLSPARPVLPPED